MKLGDWSPVRPLAPGTGANTFIIKYLIDMAVDILQTCLFELGSEFAWPLRLRWFSQSWTSHHAAFLRRSLKAD